MGIHQTAPRTSGSHRAFNRAVLAGLGALLLCGARPVKSQETQSIFGPSEMVWEAYQEAAYKRALELAAEVLATTDAPPVRVGVHKAEACTYIILKDTPGARRAIREMLEEDSSARFSPDFYFPRPVIDLYQTVRDSVQKDAMDVRTIALGDFEDNSVWRGKIKDYDFSYFEPALIHTITADLHDATHLKIVDRQRTRQILDEIELGQSGFSSPQDAVRAGKLLGAHTFIFGQYMILSPQKVRIDARVVHTETSEIILTHSVTGEFSGDPEKLLELEKELVVGLAKGIEKILAAKGDDLKPSEMASAYYEEKAASVSDDSDYLEKKLLQAKALEAEERGESDEAREAWTQLLEKDPTNQLAKIHIQIIDSYKG